MSAPTRRSLSSGEWILLAAVGAEIAVFAAIAQNFFTLENFFEMLRLSVELGLLAVALTPVIVSGGIDLSVGSMMGLAAVLFGAAYHDWGLSLGGAAMVALAAGCAGGALNAWLIAYFNIPPLIVTLGTLSLFRGIAEGLTRGAVNYTDFPASFLALGQGYAEESFRRSCSSSSPILVVYSIAASSLGRRTRMVCDWIRRGGRAIRGTARPRGVARCTFCPDWSRAWRPSFTWPISGRRNRMRDPATSWTRSRPLSWAGRRCSAGAGRCGARCSVSRAVGAAERIAAGRAAVGADRRADRRVARRRRSRSIGCAPSAGATRVPLRRRLR